MAGVAHRLGVAGELNHRDVAPWPVPVGAEHGPSHGPLGADRGGPPVGDSVPFGDAVGVELDELDERSRRGRGGLIGQQAAQLLAQLGVSPCPCIVTACRTAAETSSSGSPLIASVQPTSLGTLRQSMVFLVMGISLLLAPAFLAGRLVMAWVTASAGAVRAAPRRRR